MVFFLPSNGYYDFLCWEYVAAEKDLSGIKATETEAAVDNLFDGKMCMGHVIGPLEIMVTVRKIKARMYFSFLASHNKSYLSCRILFGMLVLLLCCNISVWAAVSLEVEVNGVKGKIKENVLSTLSINLQKNNERLRGRGIRRLHFESEKEIRAALQPFGYYNPKISGELQKKDKGWLAKYNIDPGNPVLVQNVEMRIDGVGDTDEIIKAALRDFALKKGSVLNQGLYENEKKRLVNVAYSEGFLDAKFEEKQIVVDSGSNWASIRLVLETGPQYTFGETICNQEVLTQELFERYLPYTAGEPYRPQKLFELQRILQQTDYFSRVEVRGLAEKAEGFVVPIRVELTAPEHKNKYTLGAGYATDTGARFKVDWSNRLFNNRGHKMSALIQLAELENIFSLHYDIPRGDPRYDIFKHILSYQDKTWEGTTTRLLTAGVYRAYNGPTLNFATGLQLRAEDYDVGETSGSSTLLIPSINSGFIFADDILNTHNGLQASVGFLGGVNGIISDVNFLQAKISGKAIVTPMENWRLIGRGNGGVILVDSIDSLPPSLRFYTGGDTSIRGYKYRSIGPRDASGEVIGGKYLLVGSIELERLFGERWSSAVFWDGGTATDDLSLNFYQGAGVGIRFRLPFGQIRFDVASAITEDSYPIRVHFTVGGDL